MSKNTLVIAEAGECWNGDPLQAEKLIRCAAEAGCDYIKFQTLDRDTISDSDPEKEWFLRIALSHAMIERILKYSLRQGIRPLFTPANLKKAQMLREDFGVTEVKIASSVSFDRKVVNYIAGNFRRVFLSTGMNSIRELRSLVGAFEGKKGELYILHCVSEYPTGPLLEKRGLVALSENNVNLNMMLILKEMFPKHKVGYSDHCLGILPSICAVAAGARVIEKHITLDRDKPVALYKSKKGYLGTDHVLSLEPEEVTELVCQIRRVEDIFGKKRWVRSEGERMLKSFLIGRF